MTRAALGIICLLMTWLSGYSRIVPELPARLHQPSTTDTTIYFEVFMPGPEIYELEGHAALRVVMPGTDAAVSFGTFDFNQPNFVYRFVKGETDYWASVVPWPVFYNAYAAQGRKIVQFELNLDSRQKQRLLALIAENLRPENRTYRYNYVKDNCATRPLALVEKAFGDTIALPDIERSKSDPSNLFNSFRAVMRHYHANYPWYQFGIDLALGSGIDYQLSAREKTFAPVLLKEQLMEAKVGDKPVVCSVEVLNPGTFNAIDGPTPWPLTPMAVSIYVFLITATICWLDLKHDRITRWYTCVFYSINSLAGLLLTFLIFVSVHEATSPNCLYVWLNPLCLIPAIGIWLKKLKFTIYCYQIANFVLVGWCFLTISYTTDYFAAPSDHLSIFGANQVGNPAFRLLLLADLLMSLTYIMVYRKRAKLSKQRF